MELMPQILKFGATVKPQDIDLPHIWAAMAQSP
jgi:hypothetical protein